MQIDLWIHYHLIYAEKVEIKMAAPLNTYV